MIIEELIEGGVRVRHYSDLGMKIRQQPTGIVYEDAVDNVPCSYTYEETDIPIPEDEASAEELLNIILGEGEA
jgi:hypothetical protein